MTTTATKGQIMKTYLGDKHFMTDMAIYLGSIAVAVGGFVVFCIIAQQGVNS